MQHRKKGKKKGESQGVVWDKDCPFISCIALLLQLAASKFHTVMKMTVSLKIVQSRFAEKGLCH